jgi:hypothetical protein
MSIWRAAGLALGLVLAATVVPPLAARAQDTVRAGSLDFRDLSYEGRLGSGKVGLVSFAGLTREGDRLRADTLRIERLSWMLPWGSVEIPAIRIDDFEGPRGIVDALTAGRPSEIDWIAVVNTARAARIGIDRVSKKVDIEGKIVGIGVVTDIVLEGLGEGRLGALKIAAWELEADLPDGVTTRYRVGATLYEDVDLAEIARFFTGGGSGPAKQIVAFTRTEAAESSQSDGIRTRIGSSEARGIFSRAPREAMTFADLEALETLAEDGDRQLARKVADFVTDIIDHTRVESATMRDYEVEFPGGRARIDTASLRNYGLVGFELVEVAGIGIEAPTGPVRIDRIALENMDGRAVVDYLLEALRTGTMPPSTDPVRIRQALPSLDAFRVDNVQAETPEGQVGLESFTIEAERAGPVLTAISTSLKRLSIPLEGGTPNEAKERLLALGYSRIVADAGVTLRYDPAAKAILLDRTGATMEDAGSIRSTLRVENFDLDRLLAAGPEAAAQAMALPFGGLDLEIVDLGLAQRFYQSIADASGVSADAIRDGLAAELRTQVSALLGPALAPGSAEQVAEFLRDPGKLTVRIAPRSDRPPLLVGDLQGMDPPQLADRVTVTIEATK